MKIENRVSGCRLYIWCLLLLVAGCSDGNDGEEPHPPFLETAAPAYEGIDADGAAFTVSVRSNVDWTVESDKAWCTVLSGNTGSGNADIQLDITENLTQDARTATVRI